MVKAIFTVICFSFFTQAVAQKTVRTAPKKINNDTFSIYFDLNIPELNKRAKDWIDSLIYLDKLIPGSNIMIIGYADYLGSEGHNQTLSEERAKNVEAYLLENNFRKENIRICVGKGEIDRRVHPKGTTGFPKDRKVDIAIVKNIVASKKPKTTSKITLGNAKVPSNPNTAISMPSKADITNITNYKTGETIRLKNLYFLPQRHTMTKESVPELDKLFDVLSNYPTIKIRIEGHVCCIKDYPDAMDMDNGDNQLSVNRAKAVYDFLADKGIDTARLKYVGYGKSKPIISNEETEEDANINRRVEIRIMEK